MLNNKYALSALGSRLDGSSQDLPPIRRRTSSDPCLPARLPSTAFIEREATGLAPRAVLRQLRRTPSPPDNLEDGDASPNSRHRRTSSTSSSQGSPTKGKAKSVNSSPNTPWKDPQPFEVFRAIERKDLMYLMEIRDRAFHLLLRKTGGATPLVHAMRIGQSHREVAIILLGAFSRWVNNLDDEEVAQPKTKALLKALRTNLKLAIDFGLYTSQSDLIASFLQTLIMSEGERWVRDSVASVSLALRAGNSARPVQTAEAIVRRFATKELGKNDRMIAALDDYVANATADLLMMGSWSIVLNSTEAEPIPSWYFARDDRVQKAFEERIYRHRGEVERTASRRTRWQIRVMQKVLEGRTTTYHAKVETLSGEFDEGEGV